MAEKWKWIGNIKCEGDHITAPTTANVRQTIVVKEVDGNGKPISWEAVDLPEGSSADNQTAEGGFAGGNGATATNGGAIGQLAESTAGGGAVGLKTKTDNGGSVGASTKSNNGGAVGYQAETKDGFAGGKNAKSTASNSIQLGEGTNSAEKTLQVYDYTLMKSDGTIPSERMPSKVDKEDGKGLSTNDFTDEYKDKIDALPDTTEMPSTEGLATEEYVNTRLKKQEDYFFERESVNLFNPKTAKRGYNPSPSNGKEYEYAAGIMSDYIDITGHNGYVSAYSCVSEGFRGAYQEAFKGAFYNANKEYINDSGFSNHPTDQTDRLKNAVLTVPDDAKYIRVGFIYGISHNVYMVKLGSEIIDYVEHIPEVQPIPTNITELTSQWSGKTWLSYGDSLTASGNDGMSGFQGFVTRLLGFAKHYGRGIGGQTFKRNNKVWFADSEGGYHSRPESTTSSMLDKSSYTIPDGCTAHYGYFASWDRITTMIPDNIKKTIDLILVFGVNDAGDIGGNEFTPPKFYSGDEYNSLDKEKTDSDWASATENTLGGDFDITTFTGAVASTIMKLQARCPQAMIVLGTSWSGRGDGSPANSGEYGAAGKYFWEEGELVKKIANYYSIPCIDIWGNSLVNPFNRAKNNSDGVHPYLPEGKRALARVVAEGLMNMIPRFDI